MSPERPRVLYVTDPSYPANGRRYGDEDVWLTARLRRDFTIATCHPTDTVDLMDDFDTVVVRNSGPVLHHREAHDAFVAQARRRGTVVYNPLVGIGDMAGKQYLVDLFEQGHPVIPTVDRLAHLDTLPDSAQYVVKPKDGADSIGLQVLDRAGLPAAVGTDDGTQLIQPLVDLVHEISFVFIDRTFCYAVHAPDRTRRWELQPYTPTAADLTFAQRFVDLNRIAHGIQRVDACRTQDGGLLLVELEDLNPYLSLDRVDESTREAFVMAMAASIRDNLR